MFGKDLQEKNGGIGKWCVPVETTKKGLRCVRKPPSSKGG
jgi:hypothetical protein